MLNALGTASLLAVSGPSHLGPYTFMLMLVAGLVRSNSLLGSDDNETVAGIKQLMVCTERHIVKETRTMSVMRIPPGL